MHRNIHGGVTGHPLKRRIILDGRPWVLNKPSFSLIHYEGRSQSVSTPTAEVSGYFQDSLKETRGSAYVWRVISSLLDSS